MIKAVIFDFDGVIIDSLQYMFNAYKKVAKEFGLPFKNVRKKDFLNNDWSMTLTKIGVKRKDFPRVAEIWRDDYYANHHKEKVFLGIKQVLSSLQKDLKIAIASDGRTDKINAKLLEHKLDKHFDTVVGRSSKNHKRKPHPMSINLAMKKLGVKPSQTVYIGDMDTDIHAAKNAKVKLVIGVTYGFHTRKRLHGADAYAEKPADILKIIRGIEQGKYAHIGGLR